MAFPTLFVLGGQKCGSTTLFFNMVHSMKSTLPPEIPKDKNEPQYFSKEIHFFDNPERFAQGAKL